MSNMTYCRFRNTLRDLRDCAEHMEDALSPEEHEARFELVTICEEIIAVGDPAELPVESDDEE